MPSPSAPDAAALAGPLGQALASSPDHYLHSCDGPDALFVPMDRAAYAASIFLDGRIVTAGPDVMRVPLAALAGGGQGARIGWIFHVAHCGSTLLARGLDALAAGRNLVLREPLALRQLGLAPDPDRLPLVLAQLGKRYPGGGPTLIKANVPVNFLLPDLVAPDPGAPAIILTLDLADYLLAILRSDNHRAWLRGIVAQFAGPLGLTGPLDDAEAAAALWLGQTRRFAATIALLPQARVLDGERLFADPAGALAAAASHFGIATSPEAVAALVTGPLFSTYSKRPEHAFDNALRVERRDWLAGQLRAEIARAEAWLARAAPDAADLRARLAGAAL